MLTMKTFKYQGRDIEGYTLKDAMKRAGITEGKPLKTFKVKVMVCHPIFMGIPDHEEERTIQGTSLKDAKERAGIQ